MRYNRLFQIALVSGAILTLCGASRVSAASNNIAPPVDTGSSWYVCQGYSGPISHTGNDRYALDLTKQLCDGTTATNSSSAGANVRSPIAGKVYWYSTSYGALCINATGSSRSIMLTHIDSSLSIGSSVTIGGLVGTIASPGLRGNGNISHLHLQAWASPNCTSSTSPIPFDTADGTRICGAPDMTAIGPNDYNNGVWSGSTFTAQPCTYITPKPSGSSYRFWSDSKMHHFYTASYDEAQRVADTWSDVWTYEPSATFQVTQLSTNNTCPSDSQPVFRFWSDRYQGHFYTIDPEEKTRVMATWPDVWTYEKPAYCASQTATATYTTPMYRFWSDRYHGHFYTTDPTERARVMATWPDVWSDEGIVYYVNN